MSFVLFCIDFMYTQDVKCLFKVILRKIPSKPFSEQGTYLETCCTHSAALVTVKEPCSLGRQDHQCPTSEAGASLHGATRHRAAVRAVRPEAARRGGGRWRLLCSAQPSPLTSPAEEWTRGLHSPGPLHLALHPFLRRRPPCQRCLPSGGCLAASHAYLLPRPWDFMAKVPKSSSQGPFVPHGGHSCRPRAVWSGPPCDPGITTAGSGAAGRLSPEEQAGHVRGCPHVTIVSRAPGGGGGAGSSYWDR